MIKRINMLDAMMKSAFTPSKQQRNLLKFNIKNRGSVINLERRLKYNSFNDPRSFNYSSSS